VKSNNTTGLKFRIARDAMSEKEKYVVAIPREQQRHSHHRFDVTSDERVTHEILIW
jgi:hypothetical protein